MAERIKPVTAKEWGEVNSVTKGIVEEYLNELVDLSDKTVRQYKSALSIYFRFIKDSANNVPFNEIKSRDYLRYQNYLSRLDMSSSGISLKRSAISAFNDWVITYYNDVYPTFHNYITKQIKKPMKSFKNPKEPLTMDELNKIEEQLVIEEKWQELAYLLYTYSTGCRRTESMLLLKEVADYEPKIKTKTIKDEDDKDKEVEVKYYLTHDIRCKGASNLGKVRKLKFDEKAMIAIKKWLEVRGEDDCPYLFVVKPKDGDVRQVGESVFGYWCHTYFEPVIGRRVHPHIFRESRATNIVVHEGKSIETAQSLLGHNSAETTKIYVIKKDNDEEADDAFI